MVDQRTRRARRVAEHDQQHARREEGGRKDRGRAGEKVRCRAPGHKTRHAATTHAERTALAFLQQNYPDHRQRDGDVNDKQKDDHGRVF